MRAAHTLTGSSTPRVVLSISSPPLVHITPVALNHRGALSPPCPPPRSPLRGRRRNVTKMLTPGTTSTSGLINPIRSFSILTQ